MLELGDRGFWPLLGAALPSWIPFYGSLATIALVFPDGRLLSRRWRPVLAVSIAAYVAAFAGITLSDHPFVDRIEMLRGPFAGVFPAWVSNTLSWFGLPLMLAALAAAVVAVVTRYRRSVGIQRLQIKWLAYSTAVVPVTLATCVVLGLLTQAFASGGFGKALFYALLGAARWRPPRRSLSPSPGTVCMRWPRSTMWPQPFDQPGGRGTTRPLPGEPESLRAAVCRGVHRRHF